MFYTRLKRFLLGERLSHQANEDFKLPNWKAIPALASDALSSSAYATDALLHALLIFSAAALAWSIPIALAIAALLFLITASYRQIINAYPNGGGAYLVTKENLGTYPGLVAGAALLIDYVLTVAVSVAAGVENLASAFPTLLEYKEHIGVAVIAGLTLMKLRGVRDTSVFFTLPLYFFILSIFALVGTGFFRLATGELMPVVPLWPTQDNVIPNIILLRAFASGCAALTGIESISTGAAVFREPAQRNARLTLIWVAVLLAALFLGITALSHLLGVFPDENETLLSALSHLIYGDGAGYFVVQASVSLILFMAANSSYSGFPRLASVLAHDRYLPRQMMSLGDRLVFSNSILGLSLVAIAVLMAFDASVAQILPLYAFGVFLSFTLCQAGMTVLLLKRREKGGLWPAIITGVGAIVTLVVFLDIGFLKFSHGAWAILVMIPVLCFFFVRIHKHYTSVGRELALVSGQAPVRLKKVKHTVVIPVSGIHHGVLEALQYSISISSDVRACYVDLDPDATERIRALWEEWAPEVPFVVLKSPYRSIIEPILRYLDDVEQMSHDDLITVVIPEFITSKWWHQLLHNHTAIFIRAALAMKRRRVVTSVRYHLKGE